ncbi:peptidase S8/S53 domain-containing protein [Chlamydoabsidia padenii]|nr:peptidase S8/S53 domain-containing protein [Chlamydoabsidia padenii]
MSPFLTLSFFFTFILLLLPSCYAWTHHQKLKLTLNTQGILGGRYIVELVEHTHVASFVDSLTHSFAPHIQIHRQYSHTLFKGVSFSLTSSFLQHDQELEYLINHDNVSAVYPCRMAHAPKLTSTIMDYSMPNTTTNLSDFISPHRLTQVDRVHKELKYTGKGILVGIIDSGVDFYHPALGGGFGDGYKVRFGADLVGDDFNGIGVNPTIKPGPTPLDTCGPNSGSVGHGTHVAGIIGGKSENFTGVAPDATLAAWRIFGCNGGTTDDIIIQALLEAEETGCDIINLSIGDMNGWSETITAVVASRITKGGVHVISSAGNNGLSGTFTIGSPSTGEGVVSVASFDNEYNVVPHLMVSGTMNKIPYHTSTGYDETYPSGKLVLGDYDDGSNCNVSTSVKGKFGLVKVGNCSLLTKANSLAQSGAIGMVVFDDSKDYPYRPLIHNVAIPILGVGRTNGHYLRDRLLESSPVQLLFLGQLPVAIPSAKTVSIFSSVGATFELDLRPHLGGIGGSVYSTLPRQLGSWGLLSGSSMASPYVAGSLALYLNSLGSKSLAEPKAVLEQLQNYAYRAPVHNGMQNLDSPLRQGAGLIQVYDAITQTIHISPGHLSFNDTSSTKYKTHTLHITNNGDVPVSYHVINNVSFSILPYNLTENGYTYLENISYTTASAKLRFSKRKLKLGPGTSLQIMVTVVPPDTNPKHHVMYGGFIQFRSMNHKVAQDLSVPYFGVVGKQKDLPVIEHNTPFITDGRYIYGENDTFVFSRRKINDDPTPQLALQFLTGTRLVNYELVDMTTKLVLGHAFLPSSYLPRSTFGTGMQLYYQPLRDTYYPASSSINGTIDEDHILPIPLGTYRICVKALYIFGNPGNSNDYHIRESGNIQIVE